MRNHPVKGFLHQGLPVSINPDDPGFMGYEGVTLDYLYAFLAWDLNIADLKQLCINSLIYSNTNGKNSLIILLQNIFEYILELKNILQDNFIFN